MPIIIRCPICRSSVRLLPGGAVDVHGTPPCSFTQTPNTMSIARDATPTTAERRKAAARRGIRRPSDSTKKTVEKGAGQKPAKVVCVVCGARTNRSPRSATGLAAHQKPGVARWCKGGTEPTDGQRNKARAKRSVWAVSGGLPTLGRRR